MVRPAHLIDPKSRVGIFIMPVVIQAYDLMLKNGGYALLYRDPIIMSMIGRL